MPGLVWFRRDLRVSDQPALYHACQQHEDGVVALFILTPATWKQHAVSANQVQFLLNNLIILSQQLAEFNISLVIEHADTFSDSAASILKLTKQYGITDLYFNRQYEWDERCRDEDVIKQLSAASIDTHCFDDQVIVPPEKMLSLQRTPFKVFTPFKNRWLMLAENFYQKPFSKPAPVKSLDIPSSQVPPHLDDFKPLIDSNHLPAAGETAALKQLKQFCQADIDQYQKQRDYPAINGTSRLSCYLALGVISARQCIHQVMQTHHIAEFNEFFSVSGASTWISELIWREFYKDIMFHFPAICKYQAFQSYTDQLPWSYDKDLFKKWCEGMTGFPLVDAAMRQLNQTGWMHNRLRMVTAMFLTKILFIDWRLGERYFSEHLIDLDFSANNGGWQWSASTGTDAAPYFRIFNPITQSEKFDPEGHFIRQYCPELSRLDAKTIHDPNEKIPGLIANYPAKIVDYKQRRLDTIQAFKHLTK